MRLCDKEGRAIQVGFNLFVGAGFKMDIFVSRQPIFDRWQRVYGYELLFRSSVENAFNHENGDQASSQVMSNSLMAMDLDTLVGNKKAFINITRNILLKGLVRLCPPKRSNKPTS